MVDRRQVLAFRVHAQQLDRDKGTLATTTVLDLGVQDTGLDGGKWAMMIRGVPEPADKDLTLLWTVRAAPHFYRRADLPQVAAAVQPWTRMTAATRKEIATQGEQLAAYRDIGLTGIEFED